MTVANDEAEEDPDEKPEGGGETELLAEEDVEVLGRVGEMDQSIEYIIHFAKVVELYQKNQELLWVWES